MVFGCFRHYLFSVLRRVQVEYVAVRTVEVSFAFAGQHLPQHARVGRPQLFPCPLEELGVVEDESKPKLVVVSQEFPIKFLVKSVIKNDKLVLALEFSGHEVATVSVSVNKPFLMYHFDDHL